ncbi:SDR family NAD(P)-dependent oxidoreductase [Paenibacillus sp. KQZ6P-2]|uniref:SDR family NAD(P)-dependent oxidoreductase n=1 Tax=Paenibacillus mangrovi TaxID=2931978 RepID=A0A9X2B3P1_9BACL|nr:SDR family NAD(P)-dependent oxidoreductase [Paenibacillus mangrovi]MCJ8010787.1 SDR family NAD(P)-dependent oxidoreductase [Paenibacillus mangrovi]
MKYFIITGSSRGIGEAIVQKLLKPNHHLICISRRTNSELIALANSRNIPLNYFEFDLNNVHKIEELMEKIMQTMDEASVESIYLINNAAVVKPVELLDLSDADDIIQHMNINLIAPMILSSSFIKNTRHLEVDKRILNISSGLSFNLKAMLSCYSTSKAGLETFTKAVGVEQNNVKIMGVRPGAVDTQMYEDSISTDEQAYKVKLAKPSYAADRILSFLFDRFEHGKVVKGW